MEKEHNAKASKLPFGDEELLCLFIQVEFPFQKGNSSHHKNNRLREKTGKLQKGLDKEKIPNQHTTTRGEGCVEEERGEECIVEAFFVARQHLIVLVDRRLLRVI